MEPWRGERVSGTWKTILIFVIAASWGGVHVAGVVQHFPVSSGFDTVFPALVGAVAAIKTKKEKTKD